jgi:hypothetical protein
MRGLFESRVMTLDHIALLYFDGKREMAKKRVQKLKASGYVAERPRQPSQPAVLTLAAAGLNVLQEEGQLSGYPKLDRTALLKRSQVSDMTLQHELQVMTVKAALVSALRTLDRFDVAEFSTWPLLSQFSVRRSAIDPMESGEQVVKPDGFMRVREHADGRKFEHAYFLELDRSNETQEKLGRKAIAYLEYYRSGGFAERNGRPRSEKKDFPFLVLFTCKSAARRDNAIERLLTNDPPTLTQAWLTTFDEVTTDPLGSIWIRPRDYRDAGGAAVGKHALLAN